MRRSNALLPGLAIFVFLLGSGQHAPAAPAGGKALTAEQLVDLKRVGDVEVSPDGASVVYTLSVQREADDEPGSAYTELWRRTGDGDPAHFAGSEESLSQPRWRPDGKAVTFLAGRGREEGSSLFVIPVSGGEARELFSFDASIGSHAWSPDGKHIAFVSRDPETEEEKEAKKAGRDWQVPDTDYKYRRLWIHDVMSGETRRWLEKDLDVSSFVWAPDSGSVAFQAAPTPRVDDEYMLSAIHSLGLDGKLEQLAETPGKLGPMSFSPDGKQIAFLGAVSTNDPLAQSLFLLPADGGAARNLTVGLDASAIDLLWSEAGLYMVASYGARQAVYVFERNSKPRRIDWPRLIVADWDAGQNGSVVALAAHAPGHPTELYLWKPGTRPSRVGDHNPALSDVHLARQETIEWPGADGLKMTGVLTYPVDYVKDRRYPLILQVHGGPEGVSLDGWTTSALYPVQLLAARGYVVLQPNYRGSQGRGVEFSKGDHDDLGGLEFDDILAGIDNLASRGLIDPERVGTGGWSYGGYMSAWAATRHTERFKAAIVCAGLTNWISFAGTTDIPYEMSLVHWNSWWFDEPALHWARSPMAHLNRARTPTLLVHGLEDDRVHPEQSLQMYQGLRIKAVPTEMVLYPREPHGLNERAHQLNYVERVLGWFDTYVLDAGAEPSDR